MCMRFNYVLLRDMTIIEMCLLLGAVLAGCVTWYFGD